MTTIRPTSATPTTARRSPIRARDDWRARYGPLDLRMPIDVAVPFNGVTHEDAEDGYMGRPYWGPDQAGAPGGSGIVFGYAWDDLPVVIQAALACHARPVWYDWEHFCRQFRYAIAWWEMTHSAVAAALIHEYAQAARDFYSEQGPIFDGPGWIPDNINQYCHMATMTPGIGVPMNCRAMGHVAYITAMDIKVNPAVANYAFAGKVLETCRRAARPGTGQVGNFHSSGYVPGQPGSTYTFHEMILVNGVLALCYRLNREVPLHVLNLMAAIDGAPRLDAYGWMSPISYWQTEHRLLVPTTDPDLLLQQHGDPAYAWWSTNCIALEKLLPGQGWAAEAALIGPTQNVDEQTRKFTMLQRGYQLEHA